MFVNLSQYFYFASLTYKGVLRARGVALVEPHFCGVICVKRIRKFGEIKLGLIDLRFPFLGGLTT